MNHLAIRVENLSKRYRLGALDPHKTLRDQIAKAGRALIGRRSQQKRRPAEIWALNDVSFEVQDGEVLGIIGRNGSGKSTLLKILSRITRPTRGRAMIRGRVGALLEVGTGFHNELTGRENVYMNGSILGMTRREIDGRFEEIVDFAGVEDFLDTPVKRYSSGMRVRLAFAVAAHLEPDVLIVDEVLAVGDAAFQRKSLGRMSEAAREGRTVLFVSHQLSMVQNLCRRALWLDNGAVVMSGDTADVVRSYLTRTAERAREPESLASRVDRGGNGALRFIRVVLRDEAGREVHGVPSGEALHIELHYTSSERILRHVSIWFWLRNSSGLEVIAFGTRSTNQDFQHLPGSGAVNCTIPRIPLPPGSYAIRLVAKVMGEDADRVEDAAMVEVDPGDFFGTGQSTEGAGAFLCEQSWSAREPSLLTS